MQPIQTTQKRNYGIDLLRMVAMWLVAVLHIMGRGGVLAAAEGTPNAALALLPEAFAFCAVNVYGLVSGYVGVGAKWRPANLLYLWLQVVFYSVGITLLFGDFGVADILRAALPATFQSSDYWYFTAYVGLFFLMPLLNHLVQTLPRRQLQGLLVVLVGVFSLAPTLLRSDIFYLRNGYTTGWLALLYLVGGYVRQYNALQKLTPRRALAVYAASCLLVWGQRQVRGILARHVPLYAQLTERFFGNEANWLDYTSPLVLLAALALVALFARLALPGWLQRVVAVAAPLSFSVYLIHNHPLVARGIMQDHFAAWAALPAPVLVLAVLGMALAIYLVCSAADWLRLQLFTLLRVRNFCTWAEGKAHGGLHAVVTAVERLLG